MNATTPLVTEPLVQCRGLVRSFGSLRALDDVSIDIRAGEFFTLLGPSGCGKTTLLRTIAGFETQDQGSIRLGGVALSETSLATLVSEQPMRGPGTILPRKARKQPRSGRRLLKHSERGGT